MSESNLCFKLPEISSIKKKIPNVVSLRTRKAKPLSPEAKHWQNDFISLCLPVLEMTIFQHTAGCHENPKQPSPLLLLLNTVWSVWVEKSPLVQINSTLPHPWRWKRERRREISRNVIYQHCSAITKNSLCKLFTVAKYGIQDITPYIFR